jgi:hypothetical protein
MSENNLDPARSQPSIILLERMQKGDTSAREELMERYWPRLERWAHGRLIALRILRYGGSRAGHTVAALAGCGFVPNRCAFTSASCEPDRPQGRDGARGQSDSMLTDAGPSSRRRSSEALECTSGRYGLRKIRKSLSSASADLP